MINPGTKRILSQNDLDSKAPPCPDIVSHVWLNHSALSDLSILLVTSYHHYYPRSSGFLAQYPTWLVGEIQFCGWLHAPLCGLNVHFGWLQILMFLLVVSPLFFFVAPTIQESQHFHLQDLVMFPNKKGTLLRVIPTNWHFMCGFMGHSIWHLAWHDPGMLSDIYSNWHIFWYSIWHTVWHILTLYLIYSDRGVADQRRVVAQRSGRSGAAEEPADIKSRDPHLAGWEKDNLLCFHVFPSKSQSKSLKNSTAC